MKEDEKDRVADPHHFNTDLDPSFYINMDPDPTFHIDEDPAPHQSGTNLYVRCKPYGQKICYNFFLRKRVLLYPLFSASLSVSC
jgi:hypothetical protein